MGKEEALENLVIGIERLFNKKFPQEIGWNISPFSNYDEGFYSMIYKGVHYSISFEDNNINIEVELNQPDEKIARKLEVYRVANERLNKTKHLRDQEIKIADNKINIGCKFDKYPTNDKETNELCDHLWLYIIKNVMLSVG